MFRMNKKVLSVSSDAKTIKGESKGILTGILYLAPNDISGFQVCPKATEGCKLACLYTAGRGVYNNVQQSRINKTKWFFMDRKSFMETLINDIERLIRKAKKNNMIPAVRLNGTSDIAWEKIKCVRNGKEYASVMEAFPDVKFYDYTAILNRHKALKLKNYHLTFSLKENNDKEALKALSQGYNVSVVMNLRRSEKKPKKWAGYPVIDGDKYDSRFIDKKHGHIIALHRKGRARFDITGFVRDIDSSFNIG